MKISVEISMYPLDREYGTSIIKFIRRLKAYESLEVISNTISSQIFGSYDQVMEALAKEMKTTFEEDKTIVSVLKILNTDMRP